MGVLDTEKLYKVTSVDRMEKYLRYKSEDLMKIRLPVCSELAGRRVETVVAIQDLAGASKSLAGQQSL